MAPPSLFGISGGHLRDRHPSLYALGEDRDVRVFDYLENNSTSFVWSPLSFVMHSYRIIVWLGSSICLMGASQ